jgi:hypothetical protein
MWKLVPTEIFCTDQRSGAKRLTGGKVPVTSIKATPPVDTTTHDGTGIRGACTLVEIATPIGVRRMGVSDAYINSSLRMAIKLWPGTERDEVIRRWEDTTDERGGPS